MKKVLSIATIAIFLIMGSCTPPEECAQVVIENATNQDLHILKYDLNTIDTSSINTGASEIEVFCGHGKVTDSAVANYIGRYDSIVVINKELEILKTYYKSMDGKNLFNIEEEYWVTKDLGDRQTEYRFQVTTKDIE